MALWWLGALAFGPLNNDGAREVRSSWAAELEASRASAAEYLAEFCGGGQDDAMQNYAKGMVLAPMPRSGFTSARSSC